MLLQPLCGGNGEICLARPDGSRWCRRKEPAGCGCWVRTRQCHLRERRYARSRSGNLPAAARIGAGTRPGRSRHAASPAGRPAACRPAQRPGPRPGRPSPATLRSKWTTSPESISSAGARAGVPLMMNNGRVNQVLSCYAYSSHGASTLPAICHRQVPIALGQLSHTCTFCATYAAPQVFSVYRARCDQAEQSLARGSA